jgi:hypothetical protein
MLHFLIQCWNTSLYNKQEIRQFLEKGNPKEHNLFKYD